MKLASVAMALACVLISAAAQVLLKLGMTRPAADGLAPAGWLATYLQALASPLVWAGLLLYGLSVPLWLWVLSRLDVSLAYPMVSLGFVVTLAVGVLFLGEPFSWLRGAGCALILAGVALLALDA
ncbi:EamA family transporter [Ramlibacter sp. 2FC]|uniref:EamA family transporter n=1 Tax=Ramlibacter sp. 2FC TaxID=2502188 RepID=UPI0010F9907D|nr:EamA family transporter [Ramlibacter sp. 2FC]